MGAGNLAGERQAEAGALDSAAQGVVSAIELLEDLFAASGRLAQAAVEDFHPEVGQGRGRLLQPGREFASAVRIFLRIGEQIDDDRGGRIAVAVDEYRRVGQLAIELEPVGFEMWAVGLGRSEEHTSELQSPYVIS